MVYPHLIFLQILYVLVVGKLPFEGSDFYSLFTRILNAQYTLPEFLSAGMKLNYFEEKNIRHIHTLMRHKKMPEFLSAGMKLCRR